MDLSFIPTKWLQECSKRKRLRNRADICFGWRKGNKRYSGRFCRISKWQHDFPDGAMQTGSLSSDEEAYREEDEQNFENDTQNSTTNAETSSSDERLTDETSPRRRSLGPQRPIRLPARYRLNRLRHFSDIMSILPLTTVPNWQWSAVV